MVPLYHMSFYFALVGLLLLAFSPRAVLATFDFVDYPSVALQCVPYTVDFTGLQSDVAFPLKLTVVPLNSTPLSISIPDSAWNATTNVGRAVTFLALPAGTFFLVSLDDANGASTGLVSQITRVGAFNDTSCLRNESQETTRLFTIEDPVSQCEPFNVNFSTSQVSGTPSIRAFIPGGETFYVNQTSSQHAQGTASYTMDALHGTKLALVISDGSGHETSTGLFSVGGNSQSSGTCISSQSTTTSTTSATSSANMTASASPSTSATSMELMTKNKGLSQGAIIAIAVASVVIVVIILLAMALWLLYARRKAREASASNAEQGDSGFPRLSSEKSFTIRSGLPPTTAPSWEFRESTYSQASAPSEKGSVIRNPLYTNSKLWLSSPTSPGSSEARSTRTISTRTGRSQNSPNSSRVASPSSASPPRIIDVSGASRRTPTVVSPSHTAQSVRGSRGVQRVLPSSPTATISTLDVEYMMDVAERYAPTDGSDPAVPPLPQSALIAQETYRNSAYLAGKESAYIPLPSRAAPVALHIRSPTVGSVRTMPSLSHLRSPSSEVYREPPQARVPSSPLPSPLPSPM